VGSIPTGSKPFFLVLVRSKKMDICIVWNHG